MGADAKGVTIKGGKYDADNVTLSAGFPLGVSNHFEGHPVTVSVKDGSLLVLWDTRNGFPTR
jgi:thiamine pyrophosphokinase